MGDDAHIMKAPQERKIEIVNAAEKLFQVKGYDNTSISDILENLDIARGTLYYHFKSKEEILDALVEMKTQRLFAAAEETALNKDVPVLERLIRTILALRSSDENDAEIVEQMHNPQNALMHQKALTAMLKTIPPLVTGIVLDGIEQGLFETPFPYESVEMLISYPNIVFDEAYFQLSQAESIARINAFIFNVERVLGAEPGSLTSMMTMFAHMVENADT
jgi:Transcriptional regulator